jgi:hypothetical protein
MEGRATAEEKGDVARPASASDESISTVRHAFNKRQRYATMRLICDQNHSFN